LVFSIGFIIFTRFRYSVPYEYKAKFDEVFREKYSWLIEDKPSIMYDIVLTMNPIELMEHGVK